MSRTSNVYDGQQDLLLVVSTGNTFGTYGAPNFPCAVPKEVKERVESMRSRQIEATVLLSSNPCVIDGDQLLLQQVLVNLVARSSRPKRMASG